MNAILIYGIFKKKISPKSLPYVMIGYSEKHKGFRCLHKNTGKILISRYVVLNELKYPYKLNNSVTSQQEKINKLFQ